MITGANRGTAVPLSVRHSTGEPTVFMREHAGSRSQIADERATPLTLDVTSAAQIQQAVDKIGALDVLINNASVAIYDDLSNLDVIEQHLAVNLFGVFKVTREFLPLLNAPKALSSITSRSRRSRPCQSSPATRCRKQLR